MNTKEAVSKIARHCRLPAVEFGVAGLKDRHARTRQWISAPAHARDRLTDFTGDAISLGEAHPHSAKLRRGHAAGNRFRIVVRSPHPQWRTRLEAKLDALGGRVANVYGEQRFGHGGKNLDEGLRRLSRPHRARDSDFYVNAAQSGIFNLYAAARLASPAARRALPGDLLVDATKKLVECSAPLEEDELLSQGLAVTGPMVGGSVEHPALDTPAGRLERSFLEELGIGESHFRSWGKRVRGARRALHASYTVHELAAITDGDGYLLDFTLPTGAYATSLLREFMTDRSTLAPPDESKSKDAE
jgi:tRNA pseudouridine13 synthase